MAQAGLDEAAAVLAAVGAAPHQLQASVSRLRDILGLARPRDMQFDAVVRVAGGREA